MKKYRSWPPPAFLCKNCARSFPSKFAHKHHVCPGPAVSKMAEQLREWADHEQG